MQNEILKLTNSVYKLLEFFPESDPLKNRAKEKALQIFENAKAEDIYILLGYLEIAKNQGWLNSANYFIVANEYEKILRLYSGQVKKEIKPITNLMPESVFNNTEPKTPDFSISDRQNPPSHKVTARQGKILEFLSKNEKAQVMDLQTILPDITKRTIRRDLDELLGAGEITRLGEFNQVFYRLK